MQNPKMHALATTVHKLLHRNADGPLKKILSKRHPVEIALFFRDLPPRDAKNLFSHIEEDKSRAEVLVELDMRDQVFLVESLKPSKAIKIFHYMENDDLADLLEEVDEELREQFLELMKDEDQEAVEELMTYDPNTAGGIMNPSFLALSPNFTAIESIQFIQDSSEDYATTFYIYVLNNADQLTGVVSLRQLVTCKPDTRLKDLMTPEVVSVPLSLDQEEVADIVERYGFLAVPVVDTDNRMLGVVTVDDVIDVIREEATEDIFKMAGAGDDIQYFQGTIMEGLKPRLSALILPLLGGTLATLLLTWKGTHFFQGPGVLLLFLLPVLLLLSHNVTIQTSTLVVRGFAMGRISNADFFKILRREIAMGIIFGILFGIVVLGIAFIPMFSRYTLTMGWKVGLVAALVTMASLVGATFTGAFFPLISKRLQLDPASAAGSLVLTTVELLNILILIAGNYVALKVLF